MSTSEEACAIYHLITPSVKERLEVMQEGWATHMPLKGKHPLGIGITPSLPNYLRCVATVAAVLDWNDSHEFFSNLWRVPHSFPIREKNLHQ